MTIRRGRVNRVRAIGGISNLTGDVVGGPGSGTVVVTIPANTVQFAQMQDIDASTLIGRGSLYGFGEPEPIALGAGLTMTDKVLSATGGGGAVFTWDPELRAYTTPRP
jgi:hypothetical protein